MTKKLLSIGLAVMLTVAGLSSLLGCFNREPEGPAIRDDQTQLYIMNSYGGLRDEWLKALAAGFEDMYAEESFEEGKEGVQVIIDNEPVATSFGGTLIGIMENMRDEIFFTERVFYNEFVNAGLLRDIKDIVNKPLTMHDEEESIMGKLDDRLVDYLTYSDGSVYALPFWEGLFGFWYDKELFDSRGFYFKEGKTADGVDINADGYDLSQLFIDPNNPDDVKSAGPDGEPGNFDDGLPVTYDDFFALLSYIKSFHIMPMMWCGTQNGYLSQGFVSLYAQNEGAEGVYNVIDMDKTATNLIESIDANGNITYMPPTPINNTNGYLLARQDSRYQALTFVERLIGDKSLWDSDGFNASLSHTGAQNEFLYSKYLTSADIQQVAMLHEGSYWYSEAYNTLNSMPQQYGQEASALGRQIGLMPMPHATRDTAGKNTFFCNNNAFMFVKKNIAEHKLTVVEKFLHYIHTNESLGEFNRIVGTPRAGFDYSGLDTSDWSYFAQSTYHYHHNADIVYPYTTNTKVLNNQAFFEFTNYIGKASYNINGARAPHNPFREMYDYPVAAKTYFDGIYTNAFNAWGSLR